MGGSVAVHVTVLMVMIALVRLLAFSDEYTKKKRKFLKDTVEKHGLFSVATGWYVLARARDAKPWARVSAAWVIIGLSLGCISVAICGVSSFFAGIVADEMVILGLRGYIALTLVFLAFLSIILKRAE